MSSLHEAQPLSALSDTALSAGSESSEKSFLNFQHQHKSSASSAFCSNESSPTTTCSTVDDSSATEPSPGSSPESPPATSFENKMLGSQSQQDDVKPFFEMQKAPPAKKGRNLKNLAVNTSRSTDRAPSLTSLPPQISAKQEIQSGLLSASFVKPADPPKRRPQALGLTILTPATTAQSPMRLAIPPTPSFSRPGALRHFQSSPSLPLLAVQGNDAGKKLRLGELDTIFSPIEVVKQLPSKDSMHPVLKEEDEENFDVPLSKEEKPQAYPDGPICIYEPYVDLYLEPTAAQARQYDVIFNVASEVRNPLVDTEPLKSPEATIRMDGGGGIQFAPVRPATTEEAEKNSPTTPKALPIPGAFPMSAGLPQDMQLPGQKDPEYHHIMWEHNSDIVPDLLRLVKVVDDYVQQKKRVLIHCQCGVSRSASLVVAYGLYKNPEQSVQEAYDAVKAKSKWIGPNMNLIMQLQEFRTTMARGGVLASDRALSPTTPASALSEWSGPWSSRSVEEEPQLAAMSQGHPPLLPSRSETSVAMTPMTSAPTSTAWPQDTRLGRARAASAVRTSSAYVDTAGRIVPVTSILEQNQSNAFMKLTSDPESSPESTTPTATLQSPISTTFDISSIQSPISTTFDMSMLQSPRNTSFDKTALQAAPSKSHTIASALQPSSKPQPLSSTMKPLPRPQLDASALQSPRGTEFAMTALTPPKATESADSFGLMSPTGTEFRSSLFDRSALLASLGMSHATTHTQTTLPTRNKAVQVPARPSPQPPIKLAPPPRKLRGKMSTPTLRDNQEHQPLRTLRGKISSPSLREQQRLQQIQAELEAKLPDGGLDTFMSPRATEFTQNPFALNATGPLPTMNVHVPDSPGHDPRSPAHKGANPITRNIGDVL